MLFIIGRGRRRRGSTPTTRARRRSSGILSCSWNDCSFLFLTARRRAVDRVYYYCYSDRNAAAAGINNTAVEYKYTNIETRKRTCLSDINRSRALSTLISENNIRSRVITLLLHRLRAGFLRRRGGGGGSGGVSGDGGDECVPWAPGARRLHRRQIQVCARARARARVCVCVRVCVRVCLCVNVYSYSIYIYIYTV